jgi:hypothetical protein
VEAIAKRIKTRQHKAAGIPNILIRRKIFSAFQKNSNK